ncbi:MAG TPA: hypothetical protein VKA60_18175 [Blastocatellia bacterium]|nr:hypothetical protein [Blastocatellia bacterium]
MSGTPRWSPDSRSIAFDSRPGGNADIYVIQATGGTPRRLTSEDAADVVPSWSRDGQWVYFASNRSGAWQVWKVPAEGGAATQVTQQGGYCPLPSPDGKFIYYTREADADGPLWRIALENGTEEMVPGFTKRTWWATWAVTDRGIYFINVANAPPAVIEFFDFQSKSYSTIATLDRRRGPGLSVSPDGKWILYTQFDRSDSDIMLAENFR